MWLDFVECYVDDIIVFSKNHMEYWKHMLELFKRLEELGLKLHPRKCKFYQDKVQYLGHMMYEVTISMPRRHDVCGLRAFLGLCNQCKKFAKALTMLIRNDQPLV